MKLVWAKETNRKSWRWTSSIWLLVSLFVALYFAVILKSGEGSTFPISFQTSSGEGFDSTSGDILYVGVVAINISFVAGIMMLPVSLISYLETKRKIRKAKKI